MGGRVKYRFIGNDKRFIYLDDMLKNVSLDIDELIIAAPREDVSALSGTVIGGKGYIYSQEFREENSKITAECTLPLIIENTTMVLPELHILILGFGYLGRALYTLLTSLMANVTVAAKEIGENTLHSDFGNIFDVIINTIPAPVLDSHKNDNLAGICYIELASSPGFSNNTWGMNIIDGRALPGRMAPKSAAKLLYKEILLGGKHGIKE